jgi:signal transduction histidine kinase
VNALRDYHSPLSHFEPTELFDTLSTGIVVLDAQYCPIYANVSAQDFMAVSLRQARGRPFADLFYDPRQLVEVLRRSMTHLETCSQHELVLKALGSAANRDPSVIDLIVTPLEGQVTGTYLLLELTDATQRQRITRDNELLVGRSAAAALMIRQLAHEIKNPLGGLRGAAQLLAKPAARPGAARVHRRHHQRGRPPARAGRFDGSGLATSAAQGPAQRARGLRACVHLVAPRRQPACRSIATTTRACRPCCSTATRSSRRC